MNEACKELKKYLIGSGYEINVGDYGAWIEIELQPAKSNFNTLKNS